VGLPLTKWFFVGEFLVLSGAFQARAVYGILGATGGDSGVLDICCGCISECFYGKITHRVNETACPTWTCVKRIALLPAAAAALVNGSGAAVLAELD